jgi:hypothetical protein
MKLSKTLVLFLISPSLSYAFFCPTNFNQIDFGNSTEQVQNQCGKPDKEEKKEQEPPVPQEWSYYIPQTVAMNSTQEAQGTLKTTVTFDKDDKAINISVNGLGVGETQICGQAIQLGNSKQAVETACGKPSFISKQPPVDGQPAATKKIVIYTYQSTPPQKLTFEDGILVSKE